MVGSNTPRGFTLIEVVITTALFVILALAVAQLYVLYGRITVYQQYVIESSLSNSRIIDAVRTAGLQAEHVVETHNFSGVEHISGTATIVFEIPAIDSLGNTMAGVYDYVAIYASGTEAYRIVDADPSSARTSETELLTSVLEELRFQYVGAGMALTTNFAVDVTTSAVVHGVPTSMHVRTHIYLRNA